MFFALSKIFALVSSPVTYIIGLVCLAALSKKRWIRGSAYLLAIAILLACSNKWFYYKTIQSLAAPYIVKGMPERTYAYGIVPGGFADYDSIRHSIDFNEAADRLIDAARLYRLGVLKKIIVSGDGSDIDVPGHRSDPGVLLSLLKSWSVNPKDVVLEQQARNTRQNATYSYQLVGDSLRTQPSLLITSGLHMKRSLQCFQAIGIHPDPYATDINMAPQYEWTDIFPDFQYLGKWQYILHEWIGGIVYSMVGYGQITF